MIFILHLNEVVFPILPKTADMMLALDVSEQTFSVKHQQSLFHIKVECPTPQIYPENCHNKTSSRR